MFYEYNQNNSGGSFELDEEAGISHWVIIEADSEDEADARAEQIGLYFDGNGWGEDAYTRDCECCGPRWSPAYRSTDEPQVYDRKVVDGKIAPVEGREVHSWDNMKWMKGPEGYIHYKDGSVVPFDY